MAKGDNCKYKDCEGCTYPESCTGSRVCETYRQADYDAHREKNIARSLEYRRTHEITDSARATKAAYKRSHKVETFVQGTLDNHRLMGYKVEATINVLVAKLLHNPVCPYCNSELNLYGTGHRMDGPSMDRVDNGMTITNDNVQFVCRRCNANKGARTHEEFVDYAAMVINRMSEE
jgi:hypothetical protein